MICYCCQWVVSAFQSAYFLTSQSSLLYILFNKENMIILKLHLFQTDTDNGPTSW